MVRDYKKFVGRPSWLSGGFFANVRFLVAMAALSGIGGVVYWAHEVYPYLSVSGAKLEAYTVLLSSDIAGRLAEVGPCEGDVVKRGEMLFSLDREFAAGRQMQAKAQIEQMRDLIEKENAKVGQAMEDYLTATAEYDAGVCSADKVQRQLARIDEAQQKSSTAQRKLAAAKEKNEMIEQQIKKMVLNAPFEGVVLKRFENQGAVVSFGSPVLVLCDKEKLWVDAEIDERDLGLVGIGTEAFVTFLAYPDREYTGKVSFIAPATYSKSALRRVEEIEKVAVRITLDETCELTPGLTATVRLRIR